MSRQLIGSSNVYRHYKVENFPGVKSYNVVRCTDIKSFEALLENIDVIDTEIVISVLENFIDKAVVPASKTPTEESIKLVTEHFVGLIEKAATQHSSIKFVIVKPIMRPKLKWYQDALDFIGKSFDDGLNLLKLDNVSKVDAISVASQVFADDGVHLVDSSGKVFVQGIIDAAERFFSATLLTIDDEDVPDFGNSDDRVTALEQQVSLMQKVADERRFNDNMLFARTREEIDTLSNKAKEDRIIITGLTCSTPPPKEFAQKKIWLNKLVTETLKKVHPEFSGKILFINQGKQNGRDIPMVEVRFDSASSTNEIRKAFASKRKADASALGRLFIANYVSLSTRDRIDILKAIAKQITTKTVVAHVAAFTSRPVMHVSPILPGAAGPSSDPGATRTYTFIDAISRYGREIDMSHVQEAYRRAGSAFRGQLEQHFVVLRDGMFDTGPPPPRKPDPRKRPRDADETSSGSSNKMSKK